MERRNILHTEKMTKQGFYCALIDQNVVIYDEVIKQHIQFLFQCSKICRIKPKYGVAEHFTLTNKKGKIGFLLL